eukprot:c12939_g1_i2 orf=265-435(-)
MSTREWMYRRAPSYSNRKNNNSGIPHVMEFYYLKLRRAGATTPTEESRAISQDVDN